MGGPWLWMGDVTTDLIDFGWLLPSIPMKRLAKQHQVMFEAFFVTLGVNERVRYGWYTIARRRRGSMNYKDWTYGRFLVTVSLFTYENASQAWSGYIFSSFGASKRFPGMKNGWLPFHKGDREGQIRGNRMMIDFLMTVHLLSIEKPAKQELVILISFLVA